MIASIIPYKIFIELLALLALIASLCFGIHRFLESEQKIGYDRAVSEYKEKQIIAEQDARQRETVLRDQIERAQNEATKRNELLRVTTDSTRVMSNSLHDTLSHYSNGMPSASTDTINKSITTLATVLDQCQGKYSEMAGIADRHASDVKTLTDAWQK